jgi:L-lactate dehydrogenase
MEIECKSKVAIVGCGKVGSTVAYALMMDGVVSEIALIDRSAETAEGEASDLRHGMQFTSLSKIEAGTSFELVKGAQIVVVTAGAAQKPNQSRDDLLEQNTKIFSEIIPEIAKHNSSCILLIVTNPLDVMTYVAWKLSGFSKCRVIGTGTVLDTARFRYLLAKKVNVSPKDICAHVLGQHGDLSFAWKSAATVAGVHLSKFKELTNSFLNEAQEDVRQAAGKIIKQKGATFYSIGLVVTKIVRSIIHNQSRVFSLSTILENYLGYNDVALSVPTVVRSSGVCKNLEVDLNEEESLQFAASQAAVSNGIKRAMAILE